MMITKGKKTIIAVAVIAAVCGVLAILLAFVILPKQKQKLRKWNPSRKCFLRPSKR